MAGGTITIRFAGDVRPFNKATATIAGTLQGLGTKLSAVGSRLTSSVTLPLLALAAGAVKAADEAAKVGAQTSAVLESTGNAANVTASQISELAQAIKEKSLFDDEAIQSGDEGGSLTSSKREPLPSITGSLRSRPSLSAFPRARPLLEWRRGATIP